MISEEILRARKRRTELEIKKYRDRLLKSSEPGERRTIKLRIVEDEAALKTIEEALKKFNVPVKHPLVKTGTTALVVKTDSTKRRRKLSVKKDLFSPK